MRPSRPVQDALDDGLPDLPRLGSIGDVHSTVEVVDDGGGAGANGRPSFDGTLAQVRIGCCDVGADLNERLFVARPVSSLGSGRHLAARRLQARGMVPRSCMRASSSVSSRTRQQYSSESPLGSLK